MVYRLAFVALVAAWAQWLCLVSECQAHMSPWALALQVVVVVWVARRVSVVALVALAQAVYRLAVSAAVGSVGTGGIACCVGGCAWNVEAPQLGQNARPGLISALQLGQSVFLGASERPQPLQNVSPSS